MRVYISKELAFRMESCYRESHIAMTKQYAQGSYLAINGGAACYAGEDNFFSQVVGWGFLTQEKKMQREIERIEAFYRALNHPRVDIELSPYVGNALCKFLSERGYRPDEWNTVSVFDLARQTIPAASLAHYVIKKIERFQFATWAQAVAEGFSCPEAKDQFIRYIQAKGVHAFAAFDQAGNIVAGATLAQHHDVCDLGVTSTLPLHRGKGIQKALLSARLHFARQQGASLATVVTEPGSISELNVQKTGFKNAYTRMKMTLTRS